MVDIKVKRQDGTWVSLVGPRGPAGQDGADSTVPGPQGPQGPAGAASTVPGPQGIPGSDQWTYARLASPVSISSATSVSVTGLAFTPSASKVYVIKAHLLVRTATATVGPRPGINLPTGLTTQGFQVTVPNSATALGFLNTGTATAGQMVAGTGLPTTTSDYLAQIDGTIVVGASPSGTVQVTLASETAGTSVTCSAGSWLAYREVP